MKPPSQEPITDFDTRQGEPPRAKSRITPGMRFEYRGFTCTIDTITLTMPTTGTEVQYYSCTAERAADLFVMRGQMEMTPAEAEGACRDMVDEMLLDERRRMAA